MSSRSPFNGSPTPVSWTGLPPPLPDRTGRGNVHPGAGKGYVDYKTFDQMAGELRA